MGHTVNILSQEEKTWLFKVSKLTKRYGENLVLDSVSFNLREGEILGVIGPSGGGKTTLLRCLGLLETFEEGTIEYTGRIHAVLRPSGEVAVENGDRGTGGTIDDAESVYHREIGFVFQEFNLWNWMSVLGNLTLAPIVVSGVEEKSATARAVQLCQQLGIGGKLNSKAWELSGGQRQRVAIIRALMMDPLVMLLDEITSALDPALTVGVMQTIQQLRDRGMTMVVVTHHIEFATALCDRLMFLSEGRIVQLDKPELLRQAPASPEVQHFLEVLRTAR